MRKARGALVLMAAGLLAGCASVSRAPLPNGAEGYQAQCSGIQHSVADCYAEASRACPTGYDVISRDMTGTVLNPFKRTILVACRG